MSPTEAVVPSDDRRIRAALFAVWLFMAMHLGLLLSQMLNPPDATAFEAFAHGNHMYALGMLTGSMWLSAPAVGIACCVRRKRKTPFVHTTWRLAVCLWLAGMIILPFPWIESSRSVAGATGLSDVMDRYVDDRLSLVKYQSELSEHLSIGDLNTTKAKVLIAAYDDWIEESCRREDLGLSPTQINDLIFQRMAFFGAPTDQALNWLGPTPLRFETKPTFHELIRRRECARWWERSARTTQLVIESTPEFADMLLRHGGDGPTDLTALHLADGMREEAERVASASSLLRLALETLVRERANWLIGGSFRLPVYFDGEDQRMRSAFIEEFARRVELVSNPEGS